MLRLTGKIYTGLTDPATTGCVLVGDDGVIVADGEGAQRVRRGQTSELPSVIVLCHIGYRGTVQLD